MDELAFWIGVPDSEELGKSSKPTGMCELECHGETHLKETLASTPAWSSSDFQLEFVSFGFENESNCHHENGKKHGFKFYLYLEIFHYLLMHRALV